MNVRHNKQTKPVPTRSLYAHTTPNKTIASNSWGTVASWYDKHLESGASTYHKEIVFPNLLRRMGDLSRTEHLDIACGQGQLAHITASFGARVLGVDIGKELIALAEKVATPHDVHFSVCSAEDIYTAKSNYYHHVTCVLALQNIEQYQNALSEIRRTLRPDGTFYLVINHPTFRVPKLSSWEYDERNNMQYRRVEGYLHERKVKMDMTPGSSTHKIYTYSYHRPLQNYFKACEKVGLVITHMEEWESKRVSVGPRAHAENTSRKEIPLFMLLEGRKLAPGKM